jgi:hypothetical protein
MWWGYGKHVSLLRRLRLVHVLDEVGLCEPPTRWKPDRSSSPADIWTALIARVVFRPHCLRAKALLAGKAPRWRLLEARRPGLDIIADERLARRTVNLPLAIVKTRFWLPGRFVVAASRGGVINAVLYRGTEASKPFPSSGKSPANLKTTSYLRFCFRQCSAAEVSTYRQRRCQRTSADKGELTLLPSPDHAIQTG